jgi:uncharacterized Zn finger protein (UPF0148 family)
MSCMEHWCVLCKWVDFDNTSGPMWCPVCGGDVRHDFDEADDHWEDLCGED